MPSETHAAPPWVAEFEISPELAAQLIERQFLQLRPVRVEPFGAGWDNIALRVNQRYVFRFPRRTLGATLLGSELQLLPAVAPLLPLPVSSPLFIGKPSEEFGWPFAGYSLIEGRELCRANLTIAQRHKLAAPLGAFLRTLHSIPADFARAHGAAPDTLRRLDIPYRSIQTLTKLTYLREHEICNDIDALTAVADSIPRNYQAGSETLVHGDMYSLHMIVTDDATLAGIIDWGDVHLGDPATDLMAGWSLLPPESRAGFLGAYGPIEPLTWRLARFRALNHTANVLHYAHQTSNGDLLRESVLALRWLSHA